MNLVFIEPLKSTGGVIDKHELLPVICSIAEDVGLPAR